MIDLADKNYKMSLTLSNTFIIDAEGVIVAPQGAQGAPGAKGPTGDKGATGNAGQDGIYIQSVLIQEAD